MRTVNMDAALDIFNSPSLLAYLDYTHHKLFRELGEYEFGYDPRYDDIALALAFVSVEMALDEDLFESVPYDDSRPPSESETDAR